MRKLKTGSVVAALVVLTPAAALAARMHVDHTAGPTEVYDSSYAGISTQVHSWSREGSTTVRLMVDGLPTGQTFGAHVHTQPCGDLPTDAGGHYQHSTDPSIPLAEREVWLDVTANADGHAVTSTTVPWEFTPGTAGSVVLHALPTDPTTGAAGPRLACTTVTFGS
jgi:Cu-Zn family superoxide dismutase